MRDGRPSSSPTSADTPQGCCSASIRWSPAISPKKSWEGLGGSLLFGITAAVLTVAFLLDKPAWVGVLLGLMLVITGVLGDLVESQVKRDLGIKDMGTSAARSRGSDGPDRRDAAVGGRRLDRPDAAGLVHSPR